VCRPAYYVNSWCNRTKAAPDLPPDPKAAKCVAAETVGPFVKKGDCEDAVNDRRRGLKKLADAEKAALKLDEKDSTFTATFSECTQTASYGFLVEYGDHEERGEERTAAGIEDLRIRAECDPPSPPTSAPGDPFAPKQEKAELGKKRAPEHVLTTHEEHELEAAGPPPEHTSMFFTIYFAMTGLHGFHVLAGVIVFLWLLVRAIKGHFTPDYFGPIDFAALYWHIVDLIWIFLFPLLYLIH
jgi:cytochrome c oxidase subunit III